MASQRAVLINAPFLANTAELVKALAEVRTYFDDYGHQQPPLPDDVLLLAPCGFLITEWRGDNRERIGRIEISKPDGRMVYDAAWSLDGRATVDKNTLTDRGDGTAPMILGGAAPPRAARVFNEGVEEALNAADEAEASVSARPVSRDVTVQLEGVAAIGIAGSVSVTEEPDRLSATGTVIADIWNIQGPDAIFRIDQAQNELVAVKDFLVGLRASQPSDLIGHNNPPGRIDPPDVDIEALDAAIQALVVLRPLLSQPRPDFEIVRLIWNVLLAAFRLLVKVAVWLGRLSKTVITAVLSSAFGKSFQTVLGAAAATALIAAMSGVGPQALPRVIEFLKNVAASVGIAF